VCVHAVDGIDSTEVRNGTQLIVFMVLTIHGADIQLWNKRPAISTVHLRPPMLVNNAYAPPWTTRYPTPVVPSWTPSPGVEDHSSTMVGQSACNSAMNSRRLAGVGDTSNGRCVTGTVKLGPMQRPITTHIYASPSLAWCGASQIHLFMPQGKPGPQLTGAAEW
jgi:hypothetical protein